jgi:4-amino-4-deoxy-L-arabinose transferase-like glycosyltransferase
VAPFAARPVVAVGAAVTVLLIVVAGGYGYHRDELYFLVCGRHLAWGYPDQPPLVPLIARVMNTIGPGSLRLLRTPSAISSGVVVVLAGLTARELGAKRGGQMVAAVAMATGGVLYGTGHLLSTSTFDLLAWTVIVWLFVRLLRTADTRLWLAVGAVAGIGLLDSDLVAFLVAALVLGLLVVGPRQVLRSPFLWIGGLIALGLWAPYLAWQGAHGWPELAISRSIAAGHSGTSTPRPLFIPDQLLNLGAVLAPVWLYGLIRLFRDPAMRRWRSVGVAYVALLIVLMATAGKAYYLSGMYPVLLGAGAQPTAEWLRAGPRRIRLFGVVVAISVAVTAVITLPLVPVTVVHDTPIVALDYDAGETVAWPTFVKQIAAAYRPGEVVLTSNYGEAGAVDRYGRAYRLPSAYSVHNAFWYWGPPPRSAPALAVGFNASQVDRFCPAATLTGHLNNRLGINDDEQDAPLWTCSRPSAPWASLWKSLRLLG